MTKIDTSKFKQIASVHKRMLEHWNGEGGHGRLEDIIILLCDAYDEAVKEIDMLNKTISTILNPLMKHGVIKDITLEESNDQTRRY